MPMVAHGRLQSGDWPRIGIVALLLRQGRAAISESALAGMETGMPFGSGTDSTEC
jgi:hypothetical protein